jgi:hypothetical protein
MKETNENNAIFNKNETKSCREEKQNVKKLG